MRRTILLAAFSLTAAGPAAAQAPSAADREAVIAAAKDYIDGWYSGDAARMQRALHPELMKRIQYVDTLTHRNFMQTQTATFLTEGTARGGGKGTPPDRRRDDVTVLDMFRNAASVKVDAGDWVDYLHLVKDDNRWLIINVLWELRR